VGAFRWISCSVVMLGLAGTAGAQEWQEPPAEAYVLTKAAEQAPDEPHMLTIGFEAGVPVGLNGQAMELLPLVRELNLIPATLLIEHNGLALHREEWNSHALRDGDKVEFIRVVAGG